MEPHKFQNIKNLTPRRGVSGRKERNLSLIWRRKFLG